MTSPSPVGIGRDEAQRRAAEELLNPAYERESFFARVIRMVNQFIGDLLDVEAGGLSGGVVATVITVLVIGGLAALLLWQARRATRGLPKERDDVFGGRRRSAVEHRREAERLAAAGRYAEAIRERLRAITRDLEDRAILDPQPSRTADELAAEAGRALPGFAGDLAAAARLFDDVTYGEVPGTAEGYATLRDLDERLRSAKLAVAAGGDG